MKVLTDNSTAVAYVNAMGGTRSPCCNKLAKDIWDCCIEHNIWLTAAHIPGQDNTEADFESRHFNESTE